MAAKLGTIGIWTSAWQWPKEPDDVRAGAQALEDSGYDTIWIGTATGDLELPGAVLAATERLKVATGILDVWSSPAEVVAANHQRLSKTYPNRFLLGLGASHAPMVEASGERYVRPLSRVRSFLDELDGVPDPVPSDERVLAALGPRALELAAARSAGAHPYLVTPEHTASARETLGEGPLLAPEQKVVLSTDPATARARARQSLAIYFGLPNYTNNLRRLGFEDHDFADGGSDRLVDSLVAWGDLDSVQKRIAAHLDAGADHVAVQVLGTDSDAGALPLTAWRQFATTLPSFT